MTAGLYMVWASSLPRIARIVMATATAMNQNGSSKVTAKPGAPKAAATAPTSRIAVKTTPAMPMTRVAPRLPIRTQEASPMRDAAGKRLNDCSASARSRTV